MPSSGRERSLSKRGNGEIHVNTKQIPNNNSQNDFYLNTKKSSDNVGMNSQTVLANGQVKPEFEDIAGWEKPKY